MIIFAPRNNKTPIEMKTQIANIFAWLLCLTIGLTAHAQDKKEDKLKGAWNYSLPDAPYEYQSGTIEFKEAGGKQTAVVNIQGNIITINDLKKDGDKYTCNLTVDGSDVKVVFNPGAEKITGMVTAEGWDMPITLTPKK